MRTQAVCDKCKRMYTINITYALGRVDVDWGQIIAVVPGYTAPRIIWWCGFCCPNSRKPRR